MYKWRTSDDDWFEREQRIVCNAGWELLAGGWVCCVGEGVWWGGLRMLDIKAPELASVNKLRLFISPVARMNKRCGS